MLKVNSKQTRLMRRIVCPTCWHSFPPEETMWVATHPSLIGDPKLGDHHQIRFLPTRFDIQGHALDSKGSPCDDVACPRCHFRIPRPNIEVRPMFLSVVGTPSAGKSYFLTAMSWQMRTNFPNEFRVSVTDADPICNRILNSYEEMLFFPADKNAVVKIRKTDVEGDDYESTRINDQVVKYLSPFLFSLKPLDSHPNFTKSSDVSRVLALYDNAGESFAPGRDGVANPVTQHLGRAMSVFFCYDVMQDPRCREALNGKTQDPQVLKQSVTARQEIALHEVLARIRRLRNLPQSERTDIPLIVVVTKYDGWNALLDYMELQRPIWTRSDGLNVIDMTRIRNVSNQVRDLLRRFSPELVSTVESFSNSAWFIPVSATGRPPELNTETGVQGNRPCEINPVWCDVPMALVISRHAGGLIPFVDPTH
jgi:hypothetical protein